MVWTVPFEVILLDKLIHTAWTMYLRRHNKGGYESIWIYPVCWDFVWTGMHAVFLLWNLQTDSWLISPNLAYGRGTNRVFWCLLESCMMPIYLEWLQWCLRMFSWRTRFWENLFLNVDDENVILGNHSPHLCVGFLFLILYPGSAPPRPPAARVPPPHTHAQLFLTYNNFTHTHKLNTQLCHIPSLTYNNFTHTT